MALLHDFLRAVGLTGGGSSVVSVCISCLSISDRPASASTSGVCVVGDGMSVRGNLFGEAPSAFSAERSLDVCFAVSALVNTD